MRKYLVLLLAIVFWPGGILAQSPSNLAGFTNQVLSLQVTNGSSYSATALRLFTNGTLLISGGNLVSPTNAVYAKLSANTGLLTLTGASVTNNLTMDFASSTAGFFTNLFLVAGVPQLQSNYGAFTLTAGTNVAPVIYYLSPAVILGTAGYTSIAISAAGFANTYQWRQDGTNYTGLGAQSPVVSFNNFQAGDAGSYACVVSNSSGSVTSDVVMVSMAQPITFNQQPQSQEILEGAYFSISINVSGSVQAVSWHRGTVSLTYGTNLDYTVPMVQSANAGNYYAVVDNYGTSVTSQVATVIVHKPGVEATWLNRPFVKVADDHMAVPGQGKLSFTNWVAGQNTPLITLRDGKVHFVAGTTAGYRGLFRWSNGVLSTLVFTNTARAEGGYFTDLFYPTDEGNGVVNFTDNGTGGLGMTAYSATSISNVINFNTLVPGRTNAMGLPGSYGRRNYGVAFGASILKQPGSFTIVGAGIFFHDGTNLTRICDETTPLPGGLSGYGFRPTGNAVNFDGTNIVFSTDGVLPGNLGGFYKATPDGTITRIADPSTLRPGSATLLFTNFSDIDIDGGLVFGIANGTVYMFEQDNSATNLASATYVSAAGPRIAYFGTTSRLSRWNDGVMATVLSSGQLVDGRTVSQIIAADGQGDDVAVLLKFTDNSEGIFIVQGNASNSPIIATQPLDFNAVDNGIASFYVTSAGLLPQSFQWLMNGLPLTDRTNVSLSITNVNSSNLGGYSVVVSNSSGSVTSRVAQLTITTPAAPLILNNAALVGRAIYGSNATLSVTASGAAPLGYAWLRGGFPIPGANASVLAIGSLGNADYAFYSVIVSNANGVLTNGNLRPSIEPVIYLQPASQTNTEGSTAAFQVGVLGVAPLTYQWQRTGPVVSIPGATNTTFTITNLALTNAGTYRVFISTGGNSSAVGNTVTLTVLPAGAVIAPTLLNPGIVSGQFQFQFMTQTGHDYEIQSTTNLSDATWFTEKTIPGDGLLNQALIGPAVSEKFFRLQVK